MRCVGDTVDVHCLAHVISSSFGLLVPFSLCCVSPNLCLILVVLTVVSVLYHAVCLCARALCGYQRMAYLCGSIVCTLCPLSLFEFDYRGQRTDSSGAEWCSLGCKSTLTSRSSTPYLAPTAAVVIAITNAKFLLAIACGMGAQSRRCRMLAKCLNKSGQGWQTSIGSSIILLLNIKCILTMV